MGYLIFGGRDSAFGAIGGATNGGNVDFRLSISMTFFSGRSPYLAEQKGSDQHAITAILVF
jgi:hypothetical protein